MSAGGKTGKPGKPGGGIASVKALRGLTPARLRLEPGAGPATLSSVLDFQLSHANARDAIRQPVDWPAVEAALAPLETIHVHSRAADRDIYIRRPDLGRRVAPEDLGRLPEGPVDLAMVVADGLSAHAVSSSAGPLAAALAKRFADMSLAPVVLAGQGRVGIGDEIGAALRARMVLVLIGERPGLSVTDSLGAYLTLNPKPGTPDSARNCVSNIHGAGGLSIPTAVDKIDWLVRQALRLGLTGVGLKDNSEAALPRADTGADS